MKVLVAGWFSFEQMGATAGDLMSRDLACEWIRRAGVQYDIATAPPFTGGVNWSELDPADYSHVVFVCGPLGNGPPVAEFLDRFSRCKMIGLNVSMLHHLDEWNPFELLWERDSSAAAHPDMAFLAQQPRVPVVGVILIHPQPEYDDLDVHTDANGAIEKLIARQPMSVVRIDTRLDENTTGLRSAAEIESLIARMDIVLTTRLHGMVLALKNSVPAVAVDPVAGGAKIRRQAETIGWPIVLAGESLTAAELDRAFAYCQTETAKLQAAESCQSARSIVEGIGGQFTSALQSDATSTTRKERLHAAT